MKQISNSKVNIKTKNYTGRQEPSSKHYSNSLIARNKKASLRPSSALPKYEAKSIGDDQIDITLTSTAHSKN